MPPEKKSTKQNLKRELEKETRRIKKHFAQQKVSKNRNPVFLAIIENNFAELSRLIQDKSVDINQCDAEFGVTALMFAAHLDGELGEEAAKLLLKHTHIHISKKNDNGITALRIATVLHHKHLVKLLIDDPRISKEDLYGLLEFACERGDIATVDYLIKHSSININRSLNLNQSERMTPLLIAIKRNHIDLVKYILELHNIEPSKALLLQSSFSLSEQLTPKSHNNLTSVPFAQIKNNSMMMELLLTCLKFRKGDIRSIFFFSSCSEFSFYGQVFN